MSNSDASSYPLGFTAASLRPELARIIAEAYLQLGDWNAVKERILSSNTLQSRTKASAIRVERELRQRIGNLTPGQITLLATATAEDRAAIAWLSACKRIPFAFEFAAQVLRDKRAAHDPLLRLSDYEAYVEGQSIAHPALAQLSPSTKRKIRQVLLLMLAEAGLLVAGPGLGTIMRPALSPAVLQAIVADKPGWLAGFLVPDNELPRRSTP